MIYISSSLILLIERSNIELYNTKYGGIIRGCTGELGVLHPSYSHSMVAGGLELMS